MSTESLIDPATHGTAPLLTIEGMIKDFPGNRALDEVSLTVGSGEVVAVVGHNGSGKSTLVKILAGVYTSDGGTAVLSEENGVATELNIVHQALGLASEPTDAQTLGITRGQGAESFAPFNRKQERAKALALISRFGDPFDVDVPISRLAPAQRSIIGIARALDGWKHPRNVLILDEPTEALHASEVRVLFDAVKKLAEDGAGVIFISHRLDEVLDLADRVVVLRDGKKVADEPRATLDHDRLVSHVTGIPIGEAEHGESAREHGEVVLDIRGLSGEVLEGIDLQVSAGEVGGVRRGVAFVPGDRAKLGSVRPMTARENVTLPELKSLTNSVGGISVKREKAHAATLVLKYDVKPPRAEQVFAQFSGGNQQKIVFAKWLRNHPSLLLLEEPTQGVDIGAKKAIYDAIDTAASTGAAVLVCSSAATELVRLCVRVLVLRDGKLAAVLAGDELTETQLIIEGYGLGSEEEL